MSISPGTPCIKILPQTSEDNKQLQVYLQKRLATTELSKNETDIACGTYGVEERCVHGIGGGVLREREHLEDQGVEGRRLLKRIFKEWNEGMD